MTERAKEKLKEFLQGETNDPSLRLRLATAPSGEFSMFADRERDDDEIVEYQGSAVLLVGAEMATAIGGRLRGKWAGARACGATSLT